MCDSVPSEEAVGDLVFGGEWGGRAYIQYGLQVLCAYGGEGV